MKNLIASLLEVLEIALIAIVTVFVVRSFLLQPFLVNGASMEPNFSNGDYLLVDELTYRLRNPERGEVIVFRYPGDESTYYIKRIIGLPGERVVFGKGGVKIFNDRNPSGFTIDESYLPMLPTYTDKEYLLSASQYFVMGDNRSYSFDSRSWGPLDKRELIGLVRVRLWPVTQIAMFERPVYQ